jgi:transposase
MYEERRQVTCGGPGRERERLVSERVQLENRITSLLCLHGIAGFKPRLKKALQQLEELRNFAGAPLPDTFG